MTSTLTAAHQQRLLKLTPEPDAYLHGLQVYVVGGAVRDALLGQPAGDRDWVIVGSTPEEIAKRGFIPVGGDFPVFLHPETKEEFALARTERKSGRGYRGFTFYTGTDVTLADDLKRRDLTINAMALGADGTLVDPLRGLSDLNLKVLRHVDGAFVEDPVRLLRLARFAARFFDFSIAPETLTLARQLVSEGEVDALVPERIWQELRKALTYDAPWRFIDVMQEVAALEKTLPGLELNQQVELALEKAVSRGLGTRERYAVLLACSSEAVELSQRIRAPAEYRDLARLTAQSLQEVALSADATAVSRLNWLERCDAFRRPQRFTQLLQCLSCYRHVDAENWLQWRDRADQIDAAAIARAHQGDGVRIKAALQQARIQALS